MIRLLRAELLRLRSRKLTWIALAAVLLVVGLTQIAVYTSVRPLTATEQAQAQGQFQQAQREYEQNKDRNEQDVQDCMAQGHPREDCDYAPKLEEFAQRTVSTFEEMATLSVTVTAFVSALGLLLLSASMVGAEFSSGAMSNWLTFIPTRTRVYVSKLLSLLLGGVAATAVVTALAIGLSALLTRIAGADVTSVGAAAATGGRGLLLAAIAVVVGFTLAMLTRHTIAAAGAVLGYLFLSFVLQIVMGAPPSLQAIKKLQPELNALAVLDHGYRYVDYVNTMGPDGQYNYTETPHVITFGESSLYWAVVLLVLLAASYLAFRRRDLS